MPQALNGDIDLRQNWQSLPKTGYRRHVNRRISRRTFASRYALCAWSTAHKGFRSARDAQRLPGGGNVPWSFCHPCRKCYRTRVLNPISGSLEACRSSSAMRALLEDNWRRSSSAAVTGNTAMAPTNATAPIKTSQRFNFSDIVLVRPQAREGSLQVPSIPFAAIGAQVGEPPAGRRSSVRLHR